MMFVGNAWLSFNTGNADADYTFKMPMATYATDIP
jgi:hypothetical protein